MNDQESVRTAMRAIDVVRRRLLCDFDGDEIDVHMALSFLSLANAHLRQYLEKHGTPSEPRPAR